MTRDNRLSVMVARKMAEPPSKPVSFSPMGKLEELKSGQWWLWFGEAEMSDGSIVLGSCQGAAEEADVFALETFEPDEE